MPNSRFSITGSKITSLSQPPCDHKRQPSPIKTIVAKNFPVIPKVIEEKAPDPILSKTPIIEKGLKYPSDLPQISIQRVGYAGKHSVMEL